MRRILKWALGAGLVVVILAAGLLLPVAYVELACQGSVRAEPGPSLVNERYRRVETRTLLTYPEWHIVHAYEDYAQVIGDGAPHDYGYWNGIAGYWSSLCSLTKAAAALGEVDGETRQMVYVIGASFTAELAMKALYEETVGRLFVWLRGAEQSTLDRISAEQARDYAQFLQQVPWYKWDFRRAASELEERAAGSLRDRERQIALGLEYRAKAAYAGAIAQAVAQVGADELTLRMVVANGGDDRLTTVLKAYDDVTVVRSVAAGAVIETPRYRKLTRLLQAMARDGLDFMEIAGNDQIMLTVLSTAAERPDAIASMKRQGFDDHRHLILVPVSQLAAALRKLDGSAQMLEHIHDY